MWRNCGHDQSMAFPTLNELPSSFQRFFERLGVWRGPLENGLATNRPHASLGSGLGNIFLEIIHIVEAGDPGAYLLDAG